jgi:1-deoxy-D-xylulose-5-phosphate synthase
VKKVIIDKIESPADLRKLSPEELAKLPREIRTLLIKTVSRTGGHLAPNLGVVELTIALHLVFHSPDDKIVWDVGHQSYIHKILTGRRSQLESLRQFGGLSGFPKARESEHDIFETGHSSTSISAALGLALARDLRGEKHQVVAVIGDGALTGGMAFEALNHAGQLGRRMIVVLNDNEMSITRNVGAMAGYLSRLRTEPLYHKSKQDIEELLRKIPGVGQQMIRLVERLKGSLKYLLVAGILFEELGFTYLGPIDGHDIEQLRQVLARAKDLPGPVLVHVCTKKGKGYPPAEKNPGLFHGIGSFNLATGEPLPGSGIPSYTKVFGSTLVRLAESDERLVAITAAMRDGTGLKEFAQKYPQRFIDVGIAEQHAVTLAAGLARGGYLPVVAIYSTFLQRAYDQIIHDVALQQLPVLFAVDRAGIVGEDGETHQGLFDLSYLRSVPGLVLMAPKDQNELALMLESAVGYNCPAAIRYPRGAGIAKPLPPGHQPIPIGRGELLRRGDYLALLAVGPLVYTALEVAEQLHRQGKEAAVVNCRFVSPLDSQLICRWAERCGRVLTLEENVLAGGFGSAVLELLTENGYQGETARIGVPDCFVQHGAPDILRHCYHLDAEGILELIAAKGW